LHLKIDFELFGHHFNPYISLNLEDFGIFPNSFAFASIVDPNYQAISSAHYCVGHPNCDVVYAFIFLFIPILMVFPFESKVVEGTKCESIIQEPILKSHFFDIDEKNMNNLNKGGWKVSKHVELWARNAFDE
jgi:hypothetical protein